MRAVLYRRLQQTFMETAQTFVRRADCALSGSPVGGLILGLAYVFGMSFPLFVMALLWDRFHLGEEYPSMRLSNADLLREVRSSAGRSTPPPRHALTRESKAPGLDVLFGNRAHREVGPTFTGHGAGLSHDHVSSLLHDLRL